MKKKDVRKRGAVLTRIPRLVEKKGEVKSMTWLLAELMLKEVTARWAAPLSRSPTNPVQRPFFKPPYFPSPTI